MHSAFHLFAFAVHRTAYSFFSSLSLYYNIVRQGSSIIRRGTKHVELCNGLEANVQTNLFLAKSHFTLPLITIHTHFSLSLLLDGFFFSFALSVCVSPPMPASPWPSIHAFASCTTQYSTRMGQRASERQKQLKRFKRYKHKRCVVIIILISSFRCADVPRSVYNIMKPWSMAMARVFGYGDARCM